MSAGLFFSIIKDALTQHAYDPARDIPDQTGKVVLITGSYAGIGYETGRYLAARGAKVYMACRSREKTLAAIERLEAELPDVKKDGRVRFLEVDMSDMKAVKQAAEEFAKRERRLDVLVHNAGRMTSPYELSKEGIELSIAVNHLGVAALTESLMPLLMSTASEPDSDVRVVVDRPKDAQLDSLEGWNNYGGFLDNAYKSQLRRYGMTKYMNILWVAGLQKELNKKNVPITAMALHPGVVWTDGFQEKSPWYIRSSVRAIALSPAAGAYTTLFAATNPVVKQQRDTFMGGYLVPFGEVAEPGVSDARSESRIKMLWETTQKVLANILEASNA
ncbi:NAD-P-binding protein [Vararia minispora EC-137]|uniref:NAD-P-binding protein n=1 Tax=Vararia minispora EC-137 TaxID=1314806 RepID=A0ACB8QP65_9AGAM|nr:NAD-P-binding protein [Vararia minispora EC-137]